MSMKRILPLILLAFVVNAKANPISEQTARQRVLSFIAASNDGKSSFRMKAPKAPLKVTTVEELSREGAFYVMNVGSEGYVIAAADDAVEPILGYSDEGNLSADDVPEALQALLDSYAAQMGNIAARRAAPASVITHTPISPMLTTKWSQGTRNGTQPFNLQCPVYKENYCYAGCVGVAMAQLMKYHRWPSRPSMTIPSYKTNDLLGTLPALSPMDFDWDNMLDTYEGTESDRQMNAVAQLFKYCSWSVCTNFGTSSSSSIVSNLCSAMIDYFDYSPALHLILRSAYTSGQWDDIIYNELQEGRPVVYSGQSATNGVHAFICDGCDNSGHYHVNWGWKGKHDGFFLLSLMDAFNDQTSPGHNKEDGYSMDQLMVVGIQKKTAGLEADFALTTKNVYTDEEDKSLRFLISNDSGQTLSVDYGWGYYDNSGQLQPQNFKHVDSYLTGFGFITSVPYASMAQTFGNGTFRVVAISRLDGSGDWTVNDGSGLYYAEVTVSGGKVTKVVCHPQCELSLQDVTINGNATSFSTQEIVATFYNDGSDEFYGTVQMFVDDESTLTGASGVSAKAQSTGTGNFYFTPVESGNFKLIFKDAAGKLLGTKTIYISEGKPKVLVTATIEGMYEEDGTNYLGTTTAKVTVDVTNMTSEVISQSVLVGITDFKGWTFTIPVGKSTSGIMSIMGLQVGKTYTVSVIDNAHNNLCTPITFTVVNGPATGIGEIDAESNSPSAVWNLNGQAVSRPAKSIYIKDGKKIVVR